MDISWWVSLGMQVVVLLVLNVDRALAHGVGVLSVGSSWWGSNRRTHALLMLWGGTAAA